MEIIYTCTNSDGGVQTAGREVFVRDTTCPVCKVNGESTQTVEASFPFADLGATCSDNYDSEITQSKVSHVNVEKAGTYHVTYRAVDKSGNSNTDCGHREVVRTVIVQDTLKPVIGLKYNDMVLKEGKMSTGRLMAEEAETRASMSWLAGAFAVAGVALIAAYAQGSRNLSDGQQHHSDATAAAGSLRGDKRRNSDMLRSPV